MPAEQPQDTPSQDASLWHFATSGRAIAILAFVTLFSATLRYKAYRVERDVPSDTKGFLEVVNLVRGELGLREFVPQRIENPIYPLLILPLVGITRDLQQAAELVPLFFSIFATPLLCVLAWALDRRLLSGFLAGLLGAASEALVRLGSVPLAGSVFILFYGLTFLACLMFLRRPSWLRALVAGAFGGLSWATWGVGLFALVALGIPAVLCVREALRRARLAGASGPARRRAVGQLAALAAAFLVCGRGPTWALMPYAKGLKPGIPYFKACIVEGAMYARGIGFRDDNVYDLNDERTGFRMADEYRDYSTLELLRKYGKHPWLALLVNTGTSFSTTLPKTLAPFFALFLPLALGLLRIRRERPAREQLALLLLAAPFLVVVPAVQLHDRYIYPIAVLLVPLAGIGLAHMLGDPSFFAQVGRRFARAMACVSLAIGVGYGSYWAYHVPKEKDWSPNYKAACEWIKETYGPKFDFNIMARYHGAYAWLGRNLISLPRNDVGAIARYCQFTNTRYILFSPMERAHNEYLLPAFKHGRSFSAEGMVFDIVRTFGSGNDKVHLIEVRPQVSVPPKPSGEKGGKTGSAQGG